MQYKNLLTPLKKWWKLLLAATLIAALSSFLVTLLQPSIFEARTTLMVGRSIEDPNPTTNQFTLDRQLAQIYVDIANRAFIQEATMKALNISQLPKYEAVVVPNSQFIDISVVDVNPIRAQAVANELANQLILNSPAGPQSNSTERNEFIEEQLKSFEDQIKETQTELDKLQDRLGELNSASQIADTQDQIKALETKLSSLQTTYASYLNNAQEGATNILSVMVPADIPTRPIGPNRLFITFAAAFAGLIFAAGAVYIIEFSSNTVNSSEDVTNILHAPILGVIPEIRADKKSTYSIDFPFSPVAESFRSLRTNVEFAGVDKPIKTIMVSSPSMAEGKSTVASNLALMASQAEKNVILVGADLRRPAENGFITNIDKIGLADLFRDGVQLDDVLIPFENKRIHIIPAGTPPPNPAELLGSSKMGKILSDLRERADLIIIDGSPFIVADASILAARVDGVLLVIRPEHTKNDALVSTKEKIERVGGSLIGVVLNRVSQEVGYNQGYYYSDYQSLETKEMNEKSIEVATKFDIKKIIPSIISNKSKKGS